MVHEIIQISKPRAVHLPFPDKYNPGISWSRFDSFQNSEFWNFKTKPKSFRFWIPRFLWGGGVRWVFINVRQRLYKFSVSV